MILLLVLVILAAIAVWFTRWYFRMVAHNARRAQTVWQRLYANALRVADDDTMPEKIAAQVYAMVMCAGCGCLTSLLIWDLARGKLARESYRTDARPSPLSHLSDAQHTLVGKIFADTLFYDSLSVPLRGIILRRAIFGIVAASEKPNAKLADYEVAALSTSAKRAIAKGQKNRESESLCAA